MRLLACLAFVLAACGTDGSTTVTKTFAFGDDGKQFTLTAGQEITEDCVQITLHNDQELYVNKVELTTGPGFHHSNWDFVPAEDPATGALGAFPGPDGVFRCRDRSFDEAVGASKGGTLFAQSTQSPHEVQQFPDGAVIKVPRHSKLISNIHLLNPTDDTITLTPSISITSIPMTEVTTQLAAMAFDDRALGIPPMQRSRFTVDCDLTKAWQTLYSQGNVSSPTPDFHIYHALAHYHSLGAGLDIEGVTADNAAAMMFQTKNLVGDTLGQMLDPPFDMTGYARLRFSCDYNNTTTRTVGYGLSGDTGEMCVFLAFTDSSYLWGGGALTADSPGPGTSVDGVMTFSHDCNVYAVDASH